MTAAKWGETSTDERQFCEMRDQETPRLFAASLRQAVAGDAKVVALDAAGEHLEPSGSTVNTMSYDGDGNRRAYTHSVMVRTFLWDGENIARQTQRDYTYNPQGYGELISMGADEDSYFYHYDALGSTDRVTGVDEGVVNQYLYRAFGEQTAPSAEAALRTGAVGARVKVVDSGGRSGETRTESAGGELGAVCAVVHPAGAVAARGGLGRVGGGVRLFRRIALAGDAGPRDPGHRYFSGSSGFRGAGWRVGLPRAGAGGGEEGVPGGVGPPPMGGFLLGHEGSQVGGRGGFRRERGRSDGILRMIGST